MYLKSEILKDKIKNYYGYDINPFINTFFSIKNVQSSLPITPKYDVILIIGGVLKYFREEELIRIFKVIEESEAKIILITHPEDFRIVSQMNLNANLYTNNIEQINITSILENNSKVKNILKI